MKRPVPQDPYAPRRWGVPVLRASASAEEGRELARFWPVTRSLAAQELRVRCQRSVLLFAAFALGLGLVVAVGNTFYRDCSHLIGVVLQAFSPPTSGRLTVRGRVAPLIELGAGSHPELSGTDNILFSGALLGIRRREMLQKVEGIYEITGLRAFSGLPLKYYSSGMDARLAFAVATEVEPDILLIDEALGVGDTAFVSRAKARVLGLLDRSNIVVLVSYDLATLRELCTRGLWMRNGRLAADGLIDAVIDHYLSDVAAPPAT